MYNQSRVALGDLCLQQLPLAREANVRRLALVGRKRRRNAQRMPRLESAALPKVGLGELDLQLSTVRVCACVRLQA